MQKDIYKGLMILALFGALFFNSKLYAQTDTYIVLSSVGSTDQYYQAAQAISTYRNAPIIQFNPDSLDLLLPILINVAPRYVAIVIKPTQLDINFVRKFLMMSTQLDSDPFSDFSYGFITGATAQDALNFVNNVIYAESHNIQNYPLNIGGYAASSVNFVYMGSGNFMNYLNPPVSSSIYMETSNTGSGINFFLANTNHMLNKKLLDIGYNGDPHMLWLFEGGNSNPIPPVWNYDPAKIENPAYARVGLTSFNIGALNLYPAVAFNGACHSGEPKKVMVEGDIAATFGDTQGYTEFYSMSDTFSFALSILKTGITGYFAPCGANNANDQGEEIYNAFLFHEPLGDVYKRTIDGVVMGFLGNRPNLKLYTQGEYSYGCDILSSGTFDPNNWSGACYMLGGKANRIYFGDPLFNPYQNHHSDSLNIAKIEIDSINSTTLDIPLIYHKPDTYFPVWDKFHYGNTRIYTPVELPSYCQEITSFEVIDSSGSYNMVIHAVEDFDNKKILHIEVDIPNDMYSEINYNITFRIHYLVTGMESQPVLNPVTDMSIFPNPSVGNAKIKYELNEKSKINIMITDISGRNLKALYSGICEKGCHIINLQNEDKLNPGIYIIRLESNGNSVTRKFVVLK